MYDNQRHLSFSETHHAVLFALIDRHTIQNVGTKEGEAVIRRAIQQYGNERGKRMAIRARADGQELTMTNYLVYGEWQPSGLTETQSSIEDTYPDVRMRVTICPWNNAWIEYDLLQYGRIYCQEIDDALVKGFNPELTIEMDKTLSNQGQPCEFVYRDASLASKETLQFIGEQRLKYQKQNTMPWDYHCGHLYKTFNKCLIDEFGATGHKAIRAALDEFVSLFGEEAVRIIQSYQEIDFNQLPK